VIFATQFSFCRCSKSPQPVRPTSFLAFLFLNSFMPLVSPYLSLDQGRKSLFARFLYVKWISWCDNTDFAPDVSASPPPSCSLSSSGVPKCPQIFFLLFVSFGPRYSISCISSSGIGSPFFRFPLSGRDPFGRDVQRRNEAFFPSLSPTFSMALFLRDSGAPPTTG